MYKSQTTNERVLFQIKKLLNFINENHEIKIQLQSIK